jgi:hypothetical protein
MGGTWDGRDVGLFGFRVSLAKVREVTTDPVPIGSDAVGERLVGCQGQLRIEMM